MNFGGDELPIWDVRSGREVARVGVNGASFGLAFSPDGSRIATTGGAGTADVWNADTGRHLVSLLGHTGNVWYVAYSADGQRIGTAGSDGTVRIWDANEGRQLMVLHGHAGDVYGVHFSPSGRLLQTYGADGTGRLWDISPSGSRELLTLDGGGGVEAVEFSGDGRRLLSDQYDGSVRDLGFCEWAGIACRGVRWRWGCVLPGCTAVRHRRHAGDLGARHRTARCAT